MAKKIKYQVTINSKNQKVCITKCPHGQTYRIVSGDSSRAAMVGSRLCVEDCPFSSKHDREKMTVTCSYKKGI